MKHIHTYENFVGESKDAKVNEEVLNESNIDMVERQLNIMQKYAETVKKNPSGNITHFAKYVIDGITEIKKNLK